MSGFDNLDSLTPITFQHLVNALALRVLGAGHTSFGPGPDGGRDGYFHGEAPYPSETDRWSGTWYIQSKYHAPHLSTNAQKWLLGEIKSEIREFQKGDEKRNWPDIWIIATNINPSGTPGSGTFDQARALVEAACPHLKNRFHIWGGDKIRSYLIDHPRVAQHYGHFLTAGTLISSLIQAINSNRIEMNQVIRALSVSQFNEFQNTKLEQAGSSSDNKAGIHRLFTDLPFFSSEHATFGMAAQFLNRASSQVFPDTGTSPDTSASHDKDWQVWRRHPSRSRVWFIKGGPGQGKSTLGQYLCQIQRAAIILGPDAPTSTYQQKQTASEIKETAEAAGLWPLSPRLPVSLELKNYAYWFGEQSERSKGILTYLAHRLSIGLEQEITPGLLKSFLKAGRWLFVLDGLDEVPSDVKGELAQAVIHFVNDVLLEAASDTFVICTSRPQGYAGQLAELNATDITLPFLDPQQALACATPVLEFNQTQSEAEEHIDTLRQALTTPSIRELMTTPLQAHIMAIVVRDGGKPPERKWQLFNNFYQTIKKREANRKLPNVALSNLLREGDKLLKALHSILGFELHCRAERSDGAQTSLNKSELRTIVNATVNTLQNSNVAKTIEVLMEATTDRLVLVNTPDSGNEVRFDIRPLQEFFAAEYLYESVDIEVFRNRLQIISSDSHWSEVMHFLLSALVENDRRSELSVAVEVLTSSNEGESEGPARFLHRRLAIGGLLVARLLSEGVLDQDKRIRQLFRAVIEPIFGLTDFNKLSILAFIKREESKSWLLGEMLNSLTILSPQETIGAMALLCVTLPIDHPRHDEFRVKLNGLSIPQTVCLLSILNGSPLRRFAEQYLVNLRPWVIGWIIELLAKPNWNELGVDGIRSAISIFQKNSRVIPEALAQLGWSDEFQKIFEYIIYVENQRPPTPTPPVTAAKKGPGVFEFECKILQPEADLKRFSSEQISLLKTHSGFFYSLFRIWTFAGNPSKHEFDQFMETLANNVALLQAFPEHIRAYMPGPMNWWSTDDEVKGATSSDDAIAAAISARPLGCTLVLVENPEGSWTYTIDRFPVVSLLLMSNPSYGDRYKSNQLRTPEMASLLAAKLLENPKLLMFVPGGWGILISLAGNLGKEIKLALAEQIRAPHTVPTPSFSEIVPFSLDLPEDLPLVSLLIEFVMERVHFGPVRPWMSQSEDDDKAARTLINSMIPDPEKLFALASDPTKDEKDRAAMAVTYLLHLDQTKNQDVECAQLLNSFDAVCHLTWFPLAAALALQQGIFEKNPIYENVLGRIIQKSNLNYGGRLSMDPLLEKWRQTSRSPVQTSMGLNLWT